MKLLVWLAFIGLVIAALWVKRSSVIKIHKLPQEQRPQEFDSSGAERMVCCAHCGVYIPTSESIPFRGSEYCCEEHCGKPPVF